MSNIYPVQIIQESAVLRLPERPRPTTIYLPELFSKQILAKRSEERIVYSITEYTARLLGQ